MRKIRERVLGIDLLRRLAEQGHRIFTMDQMLALASDFDIAEKEIKGALNYLEDEEWVVAIRRGVFAITTPLASTPATHPYEIASALVTPAAFSHWTALQIHQLTTEPSPYFYVLTHTHPSLPRYRRKSHSQPKDIYPVGKFLYRFVQIKPEKFFGIEAHSNGATQLLVTDLERTLWDAAANPQHAGGWAHVERCYYAARERINLQRLLSYAQKGDNATAKRVGWLLEYQGKTPDELTPLLKVPIKGYRLLNAAAPASGPYNARWMIQVNTLEGY